LILFFVPYQLTGMAARIATNESDVAASAKVISGSIIYLTWLALLVGAVWMIFGGVAATAAAIVLPVVAVAALFAIERESAVVDAVRAWWLVRRAHTGTRALRRQRSELADVLDDAYEWIRATGTVAAAGSPARDVNAPASGPSASGRS
jgi:hypothetical protein